ncbi:hypothetical protein DM558_14530 [Entomomonas moraniae]|uniref:Uncharacterized protein n=1 Tax=Entomomonas moraniae TaxID=2213226 RepID=A0A3Q9JKV8_9GAMM|nr:hypothetical protein [Entomomonas moraniae]AZS51907.1 hypothetical protein DM558_14530 [Entomomonas moraniae]
MDQQDYFILWSVYLCAAFVLLLASIFFTGFLWRFLKEPIVIIVAILLFYPILIDPEKGQYAPAIAVMAMDFLMHVGDHQVEIANDLFYKIEMVLIAYFIFAIFIRSPVEIVARKWWQSRRKKSQEDHAPEDVMQQDVTLQANEKL